MTATRVYSLHTIIVAQMSVFQKQTKVRVVNKKASKWNRIGHSKSKKFEEKYIPQV